MGKVDLKYPEGVKWTKQRKDVYRVLSDAKEPLSAVQIYNNIQKDGNEEGYALSTIYRILAAFEEKLIVAKSTWMDNSTVVYEKIKEEHTHYALCLGCRKRIPLHACPMNHIHLEEENMGFTITGHKLEIYGYCQGCKEKD